jgi:hypothetical protein
VNGVAGATGPPEPQGPKGRPPCGGGWFTTGYKVVFAAQTLIDTDADDIPDSFHVVGRTLNTTDQRYFEAFPVCASADLVIPS